MYRSVLFAALLGVPTVRALVRADGTGKLPALGWNSWNAFGCDINETKILTAAKSIVSLGLKDAGYEYVNLDDCWSTHTRDPTTNKLVPDPLKFPSGITALASTIHSLGLKIGIYGSAGTQTCAGYPAEIGHELLDASTFASWGIDYLKYDNCNVPSEWTDLYVACVPDGNGNYPNGTCPGLSNPAPAGYNWGTSKTAARYNVMRDALLAQSRTILYSLCEWGQASVASWGNGTAASWRVTGDITPYWHRIAEILNENSFELKYVNFWGHNDVDMLEIGNGNLTLPESRSHFAFWAAMKSPLIIGTALDVLASDLVDVLKTPALLAFHQDGSFGGPATPYKWGTNPDWTFNATNPAEYWSGQSEGGILVLALNTWDRKQWRQINWGEVPGLGAGLNKSYEVMDIWTGKDLGCVLGGVGRWVESHDTVGFLVGDRCEEWTKA